MAETTWKQAVYDIADAYREAEGTTGKISIANLKEKVRDGGGKVYLDGERIKQLEMTSYKGDNPFTVGQEGMSFNANTLITEALQIINGVSGEDLTDTASRQTTSTDILLKEVKRKIADHKGEGEFVWKKYEYVPAVTVKNPQFHITTTQNEIVANISDASFDCTRIAELPYSELCDFFSDVKDKYAASGYPKFIKSSAKLWFSTTSTTTSEIVSFTAISESTGYFTFAAAIQVVNNTDMYYNGSKTIPDQKTFLDYIVSSDPEAYPDGALQDGYWYERVVGEAGLTPEMFGMTKMAIDKIVLSTNTDATIHALNHSLGDIPSIAILASDVVSFNANLTKAICAGVMFRYRTNSTGMSLMRLYDKTDGFGYSRNASQQTMNASTVTFAWESRTQIMYAGMEFTLITMA